MGLGKVGVSCNVHKVIKDEGRDEFEKVLQADRRLMCDIAGKELIYVETSAEETHVLGPADLQLLLMLLWGHLCVETLELDNIEYRDPRSCGCPSDSWGPAAKRSCRDYTEKYSAEKAQKSGIFSNFKDRLLGIVSNVKGGTNEESGAVASMEV